MPPPVDRRDISEQMKGEIVVRKAEEPIKVAG